MNVSRIRGFLIQKPKPHVLRVTVDDDVTEVALGRSYAKTAETIAALDAELIECLDKDGKLLRALDMESPDARRSDAAAVPPGLAADPNALMMVHFANQIHRAYEHATEIAFTKMVEVFDIMSARSESIEQRLERSESQNRRLLLDQVDAELDRAEEIAESKGKEGLGEQMFGAFLSGKMGASGVVAPTPRPPAKANGAHKNGAGKPAPKAD